MRTKFLLAACFLLCFCVQVAHAQSVGPTSFWGASGNGTGTAGISTTTIAIASSYQSQGIVRVTNGLSSTDCTAGGGTSIVICYWTGLAWSNVASGGSGWPVSTSVHVTSGGTITIDSGATLACASGSTCPGGTPGGSAGQYQFKVNGTTFGAAATLSNADTTGGTSTVIAGPPATDVPALQVIPNSTPHSADPFQIALAGHVLSGNCADTGGMCGFGVGATGVAESMDFLALANGSGVNGAYQFQSGSTPSPVTGLSGLSADGSGNPIWSKNGGAYAALSGGVGTGTQYGDAFYDTTTTVASNTPAAVNGIYQVIHNVTAGAAVPPTQVLAGIPVNAQTGPIYTLAYSDRGTFIRVSGGTTFTLTLPAASTNLASNLPFIVGNFNSDTLRLTPTTPNNIDGGSGQASETLPSNWAALVYQDAGSPINWWMVKFPMIGGSGGANPALSNLAGVAINTDLLPASAGGANLGNASYPFGSLYFNGSLNYVGSSAFALSGTPGTCPVAGTNLGQLCMSSTGNRPVYSYNGGANTNVMLASDTSFGGTAATATTTGIPSCDTTGATDAAGCINAAIAANGGGSVKLLKGTYLISSAQLLVNVSNIVIDAQDSTIVCNVSANCLVVGNPLNQNSYQQISIEHLAISPGANSAGYSAVEDNAQGTHFVDIKPAANGSYTFGNFLQFDNDQSAEIDHLEFRGANVLSCTATACGAAIYSPVGANYASALTVTASDVSMGCHGNSINWGGGPLTLTNTILQAYSEMGLYAPHTQGGGISWIHTSGGDIEAGSCTNPIGNVGRAGIVAIGRAVTSTTAPYSGEVMPTFVQNGTPGATALEYWVVARGGGYFSTPLAIGKLSNANATIDSTNSVTVTWPDINDGVDTGYDLLVQVGSPGVAPYSGNATYVATNLSPGTYCANGLCTYTDTGIRTSYTFGTTSYVPMLSYWPGAVVLSPWDNNAGDSATYNGPAPTGASNIVAPQYLYSGCQRVVSYNQGGYSNLLASVGANTPLCDSWGGISPSNGPPSAFVAPYSWNNGFNSYNKGLYNLWNLGSTLGAPTDILTTYDSNAAKTFSTLGHRPTWDVGDAAMCSESAGYLCFRAPSQISLYVNHLPDNSNFLWRLGSAGITQSVANYGFATQSAGAPNTPTLTDCSSLTTWTASHAYAANACIYDGSNFELVQWPGTSGAAGPTWSVTAGGSTTDGNWTGPGSNYPVQWVNLGTGGLAANTAYYVKTAGCTLGGCSTASSEATATTANDGGTHILLATGTVKAGHTSYQVGCATSTGAESLLTAPYTGAYTGQAYVLPVMGCSGSGSFNTVDLTGTSAGTVLKSTVSTGTPPLTVASTTQVPNLNAATAGTASQLASTTQCASGSAPTGISTSGVAQNCSVIPGGTPTTIGGIVGTYFSGSGGGTIGLFSSGIGSYPTTAAPISFYLNNITLNTTAATTSQLTYQGPISVVRYTGAVAATIYSPNYFTLPLSVQNYTIYQAPSNMADYIGSGSTFALTLGGGSGINFATVSAQMVGTTSQLLGNNLQRNTVATSGTVYTGPSLSPVTTTTNENLTAVPVPIDGGATIDNLCAFMGTSNATGAGNTLTGTLRHGVESGGNPPLAFNSTNLSFIVPGNAGANQEYCDPTVAHAETFAQGDTVDLQLVNGNSGAVSGGIISFMAEAKLGGTATAWIVFGSDNVTLPGTSGTYGAAFVNEQNTTAAWAKSPMPRAGTAKNLFCTLSSAPVTNPYTVTVAHNGVLTSLSVSIPTSVCGGVFPCVVSDTTVGDAFSFANQDTINLKYVGTAGGTAPAISACSIEVD